MTLTEKKQALRETLTRLPGGQERFAWLVEQARQRPLLEARFRTEPFKVEGCMANLWLVPEWREGRCHFRSDSDSLVVKAIAGLLCEFYSGQTPEEILACEPDFLAEAGLTQHITPNRRNGLARARARMCAFAQAHWPAPVVEDTGR